MHQLINYNVTVYCPRNKTAFTPFAFIADHQCEISQYVDYLCLVGDKSDDIPGYRGIGPARASAFFKAYKNIQQYLDDKNAEYSGLSDKQKLAEIYKRNRLMIDLRYFNERYHKGTEITYFKNKRSPKFNEERFNLMCTKYNLKTFLTETFKKPFKALHQ
jgi:5'-3' exonuclease